MRWRITIEGARIRSRGAPPKNLNKRTRALPRRGLFGRHRFDAQKFPHPEGLPQFLWVFVTFRGGGFIGLAAFARATIRRPRGRTWLA